MRTSLSGKFRTRRTPLATLLLLVAVVFSVRSLAGQQCLEVEVLDPSSAPVSNATVSIGNREQLTDGSGLAIFCELGAGSHWIIVSAAGFQPKEASVQHAEDHGYQPRCLDQWEEWFESGEPWERIRERHLEASDEGQRLRTSHPFASVLTQEERESVYDFNWDELKAEYETRTGRPWPASREMVLEQFGPPPR